MSEALAKVVKADRKRDEPHEEPLSPDERRALSTLRKEAREHGTTLASGGRGGLPPSLVLHVMRRDEYRCKKCSGSENISLHHKGGVVESKWLKKKGHQSVPNNLATICTTCHDDIHNQARAEGVDSSQVNGGKE